MIAFSHYLREYGDGMHCVVVMVVLMMETDESQYTIFGSVLGLLKTHYMARARGVDDEWSAFVLSFKSKNINLYYKYLNETLNIK